MALPLKPTLTQIRDEFAVNTRPATHTLRNFYVEAFGSAPTGSKQSSFGNTGQPVIPTSSFNATSIQNTQFTFNFEITFLGITLEAKPLVARIQYRVGSSGGWTTFTTNNYTTGGIKSVTITGLSSATNYQARVVYNNSFNSHVNDHKGVSETLVLGVMTTGSNLSSVTLTYSAVSRADACSKWGDYSNYVGYFYEGGSGFSDANFLYTENNQSSPAPAGYYASGSHPNAIENRAVVGSIGELSGVPQNC